MEQSLVDRVSKAMVAAMGIPGVDVDATGTAISQHVARAAIAEVLDAMASPSAAVRNAAVDASGGQFGTAEEYYRALIEQFRKEAGV